MNIVSEELDVFFVWVAKFVCIEFSAIIVRSATEAKLVSTVSGRTFALPVMVDKSVSTVNKNTFVACVMVGVYVNIVNKNTLVENVRSLSLQLLLMKRRKNSILILISKFSIQK